MIKLVVGLGNPGPEYEFTRHNIAWLAIDHIDECYNGIWKSKFKGEYCDFNVDGEKRYFLKPHTYMNLSGESVAALAKFFKIDLDEILVVQDELDLPFGKLAFKDGGGLAGHNGLKSITKCMGSQNFKRLRIGIGRPPRGSVSSWVLSAFKGDEEIDLGKILKGSSEAIMMCLKDGFPKASGKYSKINFLE